MSDGRIVVEIAMRVQECDGTTVRHIYGFNVDAATWNHMEEWEQIDWMRRKLWYRLNCEYRVSEDRK